MCVCVLGEWQCHTLVTTESFKRRKKSLEGSYGWYGDEASTAAMIMTVLVWI